MINTHSYLVALLGLCVLFKSGVVVVATPTGAGGCSGVEGSVGGPHLAPNATIISGPLSDLNAVVSIGPTDFLDVETPYNFTVGQDMLLVLSVDPSLAGQQEFRGFLFRLSGPTPDYNTQGDLTVSSDPPVLEQIANVCFDEGLAGITHIDNELKSQVEAVLFVLNPQMNLTLQVTAVVQNRFENGTSQWISEFYFSEYTLNALAVPTPAPTPWGTAAPTDVMPTPPTPAPTPANGTDASGATAVGLLHVAWIASLSLTYAAISLLF